MFLWHLAETPKNPFNEFRRIFGYFITSSRLNVFKRTTVFPFTAIHNTNPQSAVSTALRNVEFWLYSDVCHISIYLLLKDTNVYCVQFNMVVTNFYTLLPTFHCCLGNLWQVCCNSRGCVVNVVLWFLRAMNFLLCLKLDTIPGKGIPLQQIRWRQCK